jgi:hypothetical protein
MSVKYLKSLSSLSSTGGDVVFNQSSLNAQFRRINSIASEILFQLFHPRGSRANSLWVINQSDGNTILCDWVDDLKDNLPHLSSMDQDPPFGCPIVILPNLPNAEIFMRDWQMSSRTLICDILMSLLKSEGSEQERWTQEQHNLMLNALGIFIKEKIHKNEDMNLTKIDFKDMIGKSIPKKSIDEFAMLKAWIPNCFTIEKIDQLVNIVADNHHTKVDCPAFIYDLLIVLKNSFNSNYFVSKNYGEFENSKISLQNIKKLLLSDQINWRDIDHPDFGSICSAFKIKGQFWVIRQSEETKMSDDELNMIKNQIMTLMLTGWAPFEQEIKSYVSVHSTDFEKCVAYFASFSRHSSLLKMKLGFLNDLCVCTFQKDLLTADMKQELTIHWPNLRLSGLIKFGVKSKNYNQMMLHCNHLINLLSQEHETVLAAMDLISTGVDMLTSTMSKSSHEECVPVARMLIQSSQTKLGDQWFKGICLLICLTTVKFIKKNLLKMDSSNKSSDFRMSNIRQNCQTILNNLPKHFASYQTARLINSFCQFAQSGDWKEIFELFLQFKGRLWEEFVFRSCGKIERIGTPDRSIREVLTWAFPSKKEEISSFHGRFPDCDMANVVIKDNKPHILVTEMVYSSNHEVQGERIAASYNELKERLLNYGFSFELKLFIAGVDSSPANWTNVAEAVCNFHGFDFIEGIIEEEQLKKILRATSDLGHSLFLMLPPSVNSEFAKSIQVAHSGLNVHAPVPFIQLEESSLNKKIKFMMERQKEIEKLGVKPIHCDEQGQNELNLKHVSLATHEFYDELRGQLNDDDYLFLNEVSSKLFHSLSTGEVPSCNNPMSFYVHKSFWNEPLRSKLPCDYYQVFKCTHCKEFDKTRALFNLPAGSTIGEATMNMRITYISKMWPVNTNTGAEIAEGMRKQRNLNSWPIDDCVHWTDPISRYPTPRISHSYDGNVLKLINASSFEQHIACERLRRSIRGSNLATTFSNLIRRSQMSACLKMGLPIGVYDSTHGVSLVNQDTLSSICESLKEGSDTMLNNLIEQNLKRFLVDDKCLSSEDKIDLVKDLANVSKIDIKEVRNILITKIPSDKREATKMLSAKIKENAQLWFTMEQFMCNLNKLKFMSRKQRIREMSRRNALKDPENMLTNKRFPLFKNRVEECDNLIKSLTEDWTTPLGTDNEKLRKQIEEMCVPDWLWAQLKSYSDKKKLTVPYMDLIKDILSRCCKITGFVYACHIFDICSTAEQIVNSKLGPATLGWRRLKLSGAELWVSLNNSGKLSTESIDCFIVQPKHPKEGDITLGLKKTAFNGKPWTAIPNTLLEHSHVFKLDARTIRQGRSLIPYALDNIASNLQDENLIVLDQNNRFSIDFNSPRVKEIFHQFCSVWLLYQTANRRPLSSFVQAQRYAFVNLCGSSWHNKKLPEKLVDTTFCSLDHWFVDKAINSYETKFTKEWRLSTIALSCGSSKFQQLLNQGTLSDDDFKEMIDDSTDNSTWKSPRIFWDGYHTSFKSALKEVFQAYQYERSIQDYDGQMIKIGNKISEGAFDLQNRFEEKKFCDSNPWNIWSVRGYTRTHCDRAPTEHKEAQKSFRDVFQASETDQKSQPQVASNADAQSTESESDHFLNMNLETDMVLMITLGLLPLPAVSRKWANIGARLMRQNHPEGNDACAMWISTTDLSLGPSSRSNSSSGIIQGLRTVDVEMMRDTLMSLKASKFSKGIKDASVQELTSYLVDCGFEPTKSKEKAKTVADTIDKRQSRMNEFNNVKRWLQMSLADITCEKPDGLLLNMSEFELRVLKTGFTTDRQIMIDLCNANLKQLTKHLTDETKEIDWSQMMKETDREVQDLIDQGANPGVYLRPWVKASKSLTKGDPNIWWIKVRFCIRALLCYQYLPDFFSHKLNQRPGNIKELDLIRELRSEDSVCADSVETIFKQMGINVSIHNFLYMGITMPHSWIGTEHYITGIMMEDGQFQKIKETSDYQVILMLAFLLPFVNKCNIRVFDDDRILCSIPNRPLKMLLSRFRRMNNNRTHNLPRSPRQKNVFTITEMILASTVGGLGGSRPQLERSKNAILKLVVFFFGRAPKAQPGPERELPVKDVDTNDCTTFQELVAHGVCKFYREEGITHPESKKQVQDEMTEHSRMMWKSVTKEVQIIEYQQEDSYKLLKQEWPTIAEQFEEPVPPIQIKTKQLTTSLNGLLDHSSWGPGHHTSSFNSVSNAFNDVLGEGVCTLLRIGDECLSQKDDEIPAPMWHRWLDPKFKREKLNKHMQPVYDRFIAKGQTCCPRPGDMGQGMRHAGSSWFGVCCGYSTRFVLTNIISMTGMLLTIVEQQGSDDKCSMISLDCSSKKIGGVLSEDQLETEIKQFESILSVRNPEWQNSQPASAFQYMIEFWTTALHTSISRAGNHKLSPKSAWSAAISEFNSRFSCGKRKIGPSNRDSAALCQGPTLGSFTDSALDLFSRQKNAISRGCSEMTVCLISMNLYNQLFMRFDMQPGGENRPFLDLSDKFAALREVGLTFFDLPLCLGGVCPPFIHNLLTSTTRDIERDKIRELQIQDTVISNLVLVAFIGICFSDQSNEESRFEADESGTWGPTKLTSGVIGVKRRIMQRGSAATERLNELTNQMNDSIRQSVSSVNRLDPALIDQMMMIASYLPARTIPADLMKMKKILSSPGLLRGLEDQDYGRLSWCSNMVATGHASTLPFKLKPGWIDNFKGWGNHIHLKNWLRLTDNADRLVWSILVDVIKELQQQENEVRPVARMPITIPGGKTAIDDVKSGLKLKHAFLFCLANGMNIIQDQLSPSRPNEDVSKIVESFINRSSSALPSEPIVNIHHVANYSRHLISNNVSRLPWPIWSDKTIVDSPFEQMITNPPLITVLTKICPQALQMCQAQVPNLKEIESDFNKLNNLCHDQIESMKLILNNLTGTGLNEEVEKQFSKEVVRLWAKSEVLQRRTVSALLPCPSTLSDHDKIKKSCLRGVIHGFEFGEKQISNPWFEELKLSQTESITYDLSLIVQQLKEIASTIINTCTNYQEGVELLRQFHKRSAQINTLKSLTTSQLFNQPTDSDILSTKEGTDLIVQFESLRWLYTGVDNSQKLQPLTMQGVIVQNFTCPRLDTHMSPGISENPLTFSASCGRCLMLFSKLSGQPKMIIVNPDENSIVKILSEMSNRIEGSYSKHRPSGVLMSKLFFHKTLNPDKISWHTKDFRTLSHGRGDFSSWTLCVTRVYNTMGSPPWGVRLDIPSSCQFELNEQKLGVNLVCKYDWQVEGSDVVSLSDGSESVDELCAGVIEKAIAQTTHMSVVDTLNKALMKLKKRTVINFSSSCVCYLPVSVPTNLIRNCLIDCESAGLFKDFKRLSSMPDVEFYHARSTGEALKRQLKIDACEAVNRQSKFLAQDPRFILDVINLWPEKTSNKDVPISNQLSFIQPPSNWLETEEKCRLEMIGFGNADDEEKSINTETDMSDELAMKVNLAKAEHQLLKTMQESNESPETQAVILMSLLGKSATTTSLIQLSSWEKESSVRTEEPSLAMDLLISARRTYNARLRALISESHVAIKSRLHQFVESCKHLIETDQDTSVMTHTLSMCLTSGSLPWLVQSSATVASGCQSSLICLGIIAGCEEFLRGRANAQKKRRFMLTKAVASSGDDIDSSARRKMVELVAYQSSIYCTQLIINDLNSLKDLGYKDASDHLMLTSDGLIIYLDPTQNTFNLSITMMDSDSSGLLDSSIDLASDWSLTLTHHDSLGLVHLLHNLQLIKSHIFEVLSMSVRQ